MLPRTFSYRRLLVWGFIVIVILMGIIRFVPLPLFRAQIAGNTPGYCCANMGAACQQMPQGQCPAGSVFVNGTTPANQTACNSICSGNGGAAGAGAGAAAATTQCSDGSDNDADTLIDGSDPGCLRDGVLNALDDDEADPSCPSAYMLTTVSHAYQKAKDGGYQMATGPNVYNGGYFSKTVSCSGSPGPGWTLAAQHCLYPDNGCYSIACLWKKPAERPSGYVITRTNDSYGCGSPGPDYQFVSMGCSVFLGNDVCLRPAPNGYCDDGTSMTNTCRWGLCLWSKSGVPTATDLQFTTLPGYNTISHVACPAPSGTTAENSRCGEPLTLFGKTIKTELCVPPILASSTTCTPGQLTCPSGAVCPANGTCPPLPPTCTPGQTCPNGAVCPQNGQCPSLCGNGTVNPPEQCDDGNQVNTDTCSNACLTTCTPGQNCPNGAVCPQNGVCPSLCGNSTIDPGEQCDIGNQNGVANSGCTATCQLGPCTPGQTCPNGAVCPQNGKCPSLCGNTKVDAGEQCDDGNTVSGDGCSATCTRESGGSSSSLRPAPVCGDGQVAAPEQCDDGNRNASDGCSALCVVEDGWQCLPSVQANPASLSLCKPFCGDAIKVGPERCDDGNKVNGDGCSSVCQIEAGFQCTQPLGGSSSSRTSSSASLASNNGCPAGSACVPMGGVSNTPGVRCSTAGLQACANGTTAQPTSPPQQCAFANGCSGSCYIACQ